MFALDGEGLIVLEGGRLQSVVSQGEMAFAFLLALNSGAFEYVNPDLNDALGWLIDWGNPQKAIDPDIF